MKLAYTNVIVVIFCNIFLLKTGAQHSCSNQCGASPTSCSCQATCESLGVCCPDYWEFCPKISPYSGTLLGGKDFTILNVTFDTTADVKCRFGQEIVTHGYIAEDGHAHCISPLLYQTGMISLEISNDGGQTFPRSSLWFSDHHSKVAASEKSTLMNETQWQYYGTPGTGGILTMTWDNQTLRASLVNIELWGYRETGKPYSEDWAAEWRYLYTLRKEFPNTGMFSFLPAPSANHSAWELGALRITSSASSEGESNVAAIWSSEHALAWHLEDAFRKDSAAWAAAKCHAWDAVEAGLPRFLTEIPDCPCTLAQARADTGRFHTDYGCDMEKGSVCTYHPGAVHCVRGIQASPSYASGQQCCYDATGVQVLTGDSEGGSTPDRGHDWGAPPYKKPPRIPGFSHWIYDVLSFYYCCLWSDNCSYYFKHRPSSGCRQYSPPRAASAFGDPHFITFDGTRFTFNGLGEYTALESDLTSLRVQGRTRQASLSGTEAKVTGFSAIAVQENNSDVVEMRLPESSSSTLEVLLNHRALNFSEQTWIDPKGLFLYAVPGTSATVMFSSGAAVEVKGIGQLLSVTILLPERFLNHTRGLFGVMNDNPQDDFTLRNGTVLCSSTTSEQLFDFGADWAVSNTSSLFTYDTPYLMYNFFYGPKHNTSFVPVFSPPEDPTDPLAKEMALLCQSDPFCRFDVLTTRDLIVGNSTKWAHHNYQSLRENLQPVVSCDWLACPSNGSKNSTNYLAGSVIQFWCHPGYTLSGSAERTCQGNGEWSGDQATCWPSAGAKQRPAAGIILAVLGFGILAVFTV